MYAMKGLLQNEFLASAAKKLKQCNKNTLGW
jgi:hypothetical protein